MSQVPSRKSTQRISDSRAAIARSFGQPLSFARSKNGPAATAQRNIVHLGHTR